MDAKTPKLKVAPGNIVRKVAWTPIRDRAIPFALSRGESLFYNLGGKINHGETALHALCREVEEEADVSLVASTIVPVHRFSGPCAGYVPGTKLRIECFDADYLGFIQPKSEVIQIAWFTTSDMHLTTEVGQKILAWFARQGLID